MKSDALNTHLCVYPWALRLRTAFYQNFEGEGKIKFLPNIHSKLSENIYKRKHIMGLLLT